ncbi:MAG: family 10 glycosylhydrolase [Clostridia bacterium]|nr:family 10 glycosylhydrolase [Clostridia bacterium]
MKKIIVFSLIFTFIFSCLNIVSFAENGDNEIKFNQHNALLSSTGITVLDSEYGKSTETGEEYYEVVVENGCVASVGGNNNSISENGYVIAAKGERYKNKLKDIQKGDYCIIDFENSVILIAVENYNPFFEKTIKFDKYNGTRTANTIVIYNTGESTGTNIWGNEACVDKDGFVISVGGNDNKIPEGGFVISAVGADRIAELNGAAAVGLQVKVDDSKKTITFAYNQESLKASVRIKLEDAETRFENAKEKYLLIDYKAAEARIEELRGYYDSVCEGLENGNVAKAVVFENNFNRYYDSLYLLLEETPVVEGRAMWLRPSGLTSKAAVAERISEIKQMGFNIICLELFYDSTFICPLPEDGYFIQNPTLNGFDLLQAFIDECALQGVELQGWLPVYRVSYSTSTYYKESLAYKMPQWLCVSRKGVDYVSNEYGNGYFIDPANKEASAYLLSVYEYLLKNYKLDGLQLDYIRYPVATGEDFGYTEIARNEFKAQHGKDPINFSKGGELWEEWVEYRGNHVTSFVKQIVALANELSPMTTVSCDVAPNLADSKESHLQNSELWMKQGLINMAFPMAYGTNVVQMYGGYTVEACGDGVFAYIGLGDYGTETCINQILDSRYIGADGFAFVSYAQYVAGNYGDKIASTILKTPALSPTFNCKAATLAQLKAIVKRIELMQDIPEAEKLNEFKEKVNSLITVLESGKLSDSAQEILKLANEIPSLTDKNASAALIRDFKLLKKIIANNKDDHRTFVETPENNLSEDSGSTSEFVFPAWGYAVGGVIVLAIVGAIIVILDRKKKVNK